jgi:hypothetical protein
VSGVGGQAAGQGWTWKDLMPVIENKKFAYTQADLDVAPKVRRDAMLAHNRSLIGPNRNTQAIFKVSGGRVCVDCAIWKPWSAYYADNARAGGSGHMGRCIECNSDDCRRRRIERM